MKISKKEKNALIIVGAVIIGIAYYYLVFEVQSEKNEQLENQRTTLQSDYDAKTAKIANLPKLESNNKNLYSDLCIRTMGYYPTILQEKIILELDDFMAKNGVKGSINFGKEEVKTVEKIGAPYIGKSNGALGELADSITGNAKEDDYSDPDTGDSSVDCQQMTVDIDFADTTYDSLKKFIVALEGYDRKITINKMDSKVETNGNLSGTISLEFYGVAKLDASKDEYLNWTIKNVYGKEKLFSNGLASGAYNTSIEEQASKTDVNDFAMILRAPSSDMPTLTMGKTKDTSRESYLYSDKKDSETVTIEFTEQNGTLYYKYKTSSDFYPKNNDGVGVEFKPLSDNIVFEILSEARIGSDDKEVVNINFVNNTNKVVSVVVKNDDSSNPRVNITSEGTSATSVTKK